MYAAVGGGVRHHGTPLFQQYISPHLKNVSFSETDLGLETDSDYLMEYYDDDKGDSRHQEIGQGGDDLISAVHEFLEQFSNQAKFMETKSKISNNLKKKDIKNLKFLTRDLLSRTETEDIDHGFDLLASLEDQGYMNMANTTVLAELLTVIRRIDLAKLLVRDMPGWKKFLKSSSLFLSAHRKKLYEIAEELTSKDVKPLTAILADYNVSKKARSDIIDSIDFLEVLEDHEILSEDNTAELQDILEMGGKSSCVDVLLSRDVSSMKRQASILPNNDAHSYQHNQPTQVRVPPAPASRPPSTTNSWPNKVGRTSQTAVAVPNNVVRGPPAAITGPSMDELPSYKMDAKPRGFCVIINNINFAPIHETNQPLNERQGSRIDCKNLEYVFHKLHFDVVVYENLTSQQMFQVLTEYAVKKNHKDKDCFVCCILTHGRKDSVYGVDGKLLSMNELTNPFKGQLCPSLSGKPKLFFVQACQGRDRQPGFPESSGTNTQLPYPVPSASYASSSDLETDEPYRETPDVPNEADLLLFYATVPGFVSYRSKSQGSWFITALVKSLDTYHNKYDLSTILSNVNSEVANQTAPVNGGRYKQIPMYHTTLRKRIFFTTR